MTAFRRVQEVMKAAGIPDGPHACPKGLRHGFGVQAVSRGIALNMVQKWLGRVCKLPLPWEQAGFAQSQSPFVGSSVRSVLRLTGESPGYQLSGSSLQTRPRTCSAHHDRDLRERRGRGGAEYRSPDVVTGPLKMEPF